MLRKSAKLKSDKNLITWTHVLPVKMAWAIVQLIILDIKKSQLPKLVIEVL